MSRSPLFILVLNENFINKIKNIDKIFSYNNRGFFYITDNREYKFYINDDIKHNDFVLEKLKNNVYKFNYDSLLITVDENNEKENKEYQNNGIDGLIEMIKQKYPNIKYVFTNKKRNIIDTIYKQMEDEGKVKSFDEFIEKHYFLILEITDKNLYFIYNKEELEKSYEIRNFVSYIEIIENAVINSIDLSSVINSSKYKKYKDKLILVYRKCNDLDKISRILYFTNNRLSPDYIRSYQYNYNVNYRGYHNYDYDYNYGYGYDYAYDEDEYWDRHVTTYEDILEDDEEYYTQNSAIIDKVINNFYEHDIFEHIKNANTIINKKIKEFFDTLCIIKRETTGYIITRDVNSDSNINKNLDIIVCDNYFMYRLFHDLKMYNCEKSTLSVSYIKNKFSEISDFISVIRISRFANPVKIILHHLITNSENKNAILIPSDKYMTGATINGIIKQILKSHSQNQNIIIDLKSLVYIDTNECFSFLFDEITEYITDNDEEILSYYDYRIEKERKKLLYIIKTEILPYISKEFPELYPSLNIRCSNIFCYYDEILQQLLIFDSNKDKTI